MNTHRSGYTCEQAEREIDLQMRAKLEAQDCLRLICTALALPLDEFADGWMASLPIILRRLEMIIDEGEQGSASSSRGTSGGSVDEQAALLIHLCEPVPGDTPKARLVCGRAMRHITDPNEGWVFSLDDGPVRVTCSRCLRRVERRKTGVR